MRLKLVSLFWLVLVFYGCDRVEKAQPVRRDIVDAVFASGHIVSANEYKVTANTDGYLVKSFVEEGDAVKIQMPLFQISNEVQSEQLSNAKINHKDALKKLDVHSPERVQAQLQIEQAQSQLYVDQRNFERHEKLLSSNAVSKLDYERAKLQYENAKRNVQLQQRALDDLVNQLKLSAQNSETQLIIQERNNSDYFLSSNIQGEVLQVFKQPGELVRRGEVVALIGGGSKVAKLFVSEEDILEIALKQKVVIELNTNKGQKYEGFIHKIFPSFDETEQSFVVEAAFHDVPKALYHNTQLQANIIVEEKANALVISPVFLMEGDSVLLESGLLKSVQVGRRSSDWIEILDGLHAEEVLQRPEQL